MTTAMDGSRRTIIGRDEEMAVGGRFLDALAVSPAALLIEGEAGIGKTTVWAEVRRRAHERGYVVLATEPVESETELPFAGLLDLVGRELDGLPDLPAPQRRALEIATARAEPGPTEAVGALAAAAGFLSILAARSAEAPVLVAIDDLQWLDPPTLRVVSFATRRVGPLRIGILGTIRTPSALDPGVPVVDHGIDAERLRLGPLSIASLYHMIDHRLGASLPRYALTRIEQASGGNPIVAIEMARQLVAGGSAPGPAGIPVPDHVAHLVARRLDPLSDRTREALLACAALARPTTDVVAAAELEPAINAGIVTLDVDGRIRFAHPLLARAVYSAALPQGRARVHGRLARRVDDPDERALHAALASPRRDSNLALRLHEVAERARRKGAPEFAAEIEERAAARTPLDQPGMALERSLRAAEHHERAGDVERATTLAREVAERSVDATVRARARWLIADIAYGQSFPSAIELLDAASREPGLDAASLAELRARQAFTAMAQLRLEEALAHARDAERLAETAGESGLLAEILGLRAYISAIRDDDVDRVAIERSLALEDPHRESPMQHRPRLNAATLDALYGHLDRAEAGLVAEHRQIVESGEDHELPYVSCLLALVALLRGDHGKARGYAAEAIRTARMVGSETMRGFGIAVRALISAYAGDRAGAVADAGDASAIFARVEWPIGAMYGMKALSMLALEAGDVGELERQVAAAADSLGTVFGFSGPALFVEEAVDLHLSCGRVDEARRLAEAFATAGVSADAPLARVIGLRGMALAEAASGDLDRAIKTIEEARATAYRLAIPSELGRTELARGQILRRLRRKQAAGDAFRAAGVAFAAGGMPTWAARADGELARVGLRRGSRDELTDTERRIAVLAAAGLTNREVAAQAFVSPRTVEDVLGRVYGKLGIGSRAELGARMRPPDELPTSPTSPTSTGTAGPSQRR